jgi:hypothetical protein
MDRITIEPPNQNHPWRDSRQAERGSACPKAAEAAPRPGLSPRGVAISMEIEQLIYEAGRLWDAASLLKLASE